MESPTARPEGALIRLARKARGITIPEAAAAAGISKARWSQVESGRETRNGIAKTVQAKAGTIAHMAHAVGLSPERLAEEGQRPDAAEILREIIRTETVRAVPLPPAVPAGDDPGDALIEALIAASGELRDALGALWRLPYPREERLKIIYALLHEVRTAGMEDRAGIALHHANDCFVTIVSRNAISAAAAPLSA